MLMTSTLKMTDYVNQHALARKEIFRLGYEKYGPHINHRFSYHNSDHPAEVTTIADKIGRICISEGLTTEFNLEKVLTAGSGHDYEVALGSGINEKVSSKKIVKILNKPEYPLLNGEVADHTGKLINCTITEITEDDLVQNVDEEDIGSKILCDGDLWSLGAISKEYLRNFFNLHRELNFGIEDIEQRKENLLILAKRNINYLKNHQWHLPVTELVLPHKLDNYELMFNLFYKNQQWLTDRAA